MKDELAEFLRGIADRVAAGKYGDDIACVDIQLITGAKQLSIFHWGPELMHQVAGYKPGAKLNNAERSKLGLP